MGSSAATETESDHTPNKCHCWYLLLLVVLIALNAAVAGGLYFTNHCLSQDASTWQSYQVQHCAVYARSSAGLDEDRQVDDLLANGVWRGIYGADVHSFRELAPGFARDKHTIYFEDLAIEEADPASFTPIAGQYSKDSERVFWRDQVVPEASPSDFKLLQSAPELALNNDHLYYRGRLLTESPNETELSVTAPTSQQPVFPGESIVVRWNAGLYFDHILLQLIDQTGAVFWLADRPIPNTGSHVLTIPPDTALAGIYSTKLIGVSTENGLASFSQQPEALLVENAAVNLYLDSKTPDHTHLNVSANQSVTISWQARNVTGCVLSGPNSSRSVVAERGLIRTNISDFTDHPGPFDITMDCETKTGRPIGDRLSLYVGDTPPLLITSDTATSSASHEDTTFRELSPHLFTNGATVFFDAGFSTLRPIPAITPSEISFQSPRFLSTDTAVWYRNCSPAGICYLSYLPGADPDSFTVLTEHYVKDNTTVYLTLSTNENPDTLELIPIPTADPATFEPLGHVFAKDARRVYYADKPIGGADPDSFAPFPLSMGYQGAIMFKDSNTMYIYQETDPRHRHESFRARPVPVNPR